MKKLAIVGVSGSGKTTLSQFISRTTNIPHIELDRLVWLHNWNEVADDVLCKYTRQVLIHQDAWIIDGNYDRKLGNIRYEIYKLADEVVWIDLPPLTTIYRLLKRVLQDLITGRILFNGNQQSWRRAFLMQNALVSYTIRSYFKQRRELPALLRAIGVPFTRLKSAQEIKNWMSKIAYK